MYYRTYKFLKRNPKRNDSEVAEANEEFVVDDPKFIVRDEYAERFHVFESYADFKQWFNHPSNTTRTLHEVIRGGQKQKLKFDIDAKAEDITSDIPEIQQPTPPAVESNYGIDVLDNCLLALTTAEQQKYEKDLAAWKLFTPEQRQRKYIFNQFMNTLIRVFNDYYDRTITPADFAISDSSDATKFSRHVVIKTYHVPTSHDAAVFTAVLAKKLPGFVAKFIDMDVNKSTQNFRLPLCYKVESPGRVKNLMAGSMFDDLIITQVNGTDSLPGTTAVIHDTPAELTAADDATVLALAAPFTVGLEFQHKHKNLFMYRRKSSSLCCICGRVHDKDNTHFVTVSAGYVKLHCRHSQQYLGAKQSKTIGKITAADEKIPTIFGETPKEPAITDEIPDKFSREEYNAKEAREILFGTHDALLIKSNMGTGKTKALVTYIEKLPADIHVIIISFRRSYTTKMKADLGGKFVDYRDVKGPIKSTRVIIQLESLHRLELPIGKRVMLVLDESESILTQVENPSTVRAGTMKANWKNFEWLVRNSEKLIAMDALASHRTYTLLEKTRNNVHMHINSYVPENPPQDIYYKHVDEFHREVMDAASRAKEAPIVIVTSSRAEAETLNKKIMAYGVQIAMYTGDSTEQVKAQLNDVHAAWATVDVLIYTSTISAGCSFELPRFTKVFAYFTSKSCDFITCIQMLGRVRDISSREYHIYVDSHPADMPNTMKAVEQAMADRADIAGIDTNPMGMPTMINIRGGNEYSLKDLYYHIHCGNVLHRCRSMNNFRSLLVSARRSMGAQIKKNDMKPEESTAGEFRKIKEQLKVDNATEIAQAKALDENEQKKLEASDIITRNERNSLTLHKLGDIYHIPVEKIDKDFVLKYNKPKLIANFYNLNALQRSTESIQTAIENWRKGTKIGFDGQEIEATNESINDGSLSGRRDNLLKCMFAIDALNAVMEKTDGQNGYCHVMKHFRKRFVARAVIIAGIDQYIARLQQHADALSLIFNIPKSKFLQPRGELKQKLELVNSILRATFGISIKGEKKKGTASHLYELVEPKHFQWCEKTQSYTPLIKSTQ